MLEWNKKKTIGLVIIALSSFLDLFLETFLDGGVTLFRIMPFLVVGYFALRTRETFKNFFYFSLIVLSLIHSIVLVILLLELATSPTLIESLIELFYSFVIMIMWFNAIFTFLVLIKFVFNIMIGSKNKEKD